MPKFFCDYCDVYLTHDSMSVRKAHNSGRNHLRNVVDYYQQIGQEKAQSVIDSITSSYAAAGQASSNPMLSHMGGAGAFGPPQGFHPGFAGPGGPFPPPPGMPPMGFMPPGQGGMPMPPQGAPPGFTPLNIPPPRGLPPGFSPPAGMPPAGSPPSGMPFRPPGGEQGLPGMPPGFPHNGPNGAPNGMSGGPPGSAPFRGS